MLSSKYLIRYIILFILLIFLLIVTFWMTSLKSVGIFKMAPPGKIFSAVFQHLQIVLAAELLAIFIGIPVGFIISRPIFKYISPFLVGTANIGQTVPTLAFIGIAGALLGMGYSAAVVALFAYAILPVIRNTYAGIHAVNPAVKEAAKGMGMTKWQVATRIELSLATPVIMAGIRTSTVVNVGTATVAGMIGAGGLGELIVAGIAVRVPQLILQGAAPTAALAIILDTLLGVVEVSLIPKGLRKVN
jgi:osmoprotectant transport system permease protein